MGDNVGNKENDLIATNLNYGSADVLHTLNSEFKNVPDSDSDEHDHDN